MERYSSNSGKVSGANAFEVGDDFIIVSFGGRSYEYTYASCGQRHVEAMKYHARASRGLSTYVAQHKPRYARKW